MAKGKFSKNKESGHPWKMEETAELPQIPPQEPGPEEDRPAAPADERNSDIPSMPELDFHNLTEEELSDLSWLDIPELTALELELHGNGQKAEENQPLDENPSQESQERQTDSAQADQEVAEIEEAFRQASPPEKPKKKPADPAKRKKVLITCSALLGVLLLVLVLASVLPMIFDPYNRQILEGVSAAGVDLGGMTKSEAAEALEQQALPKFAETDMVITLPDQTITLKPADSEITLDVNGTVKAAYRYGRSGSKKEREQAYRLALTEPQAVDLVPYLSVNKNYIHGQVQTYALEHKTVFAPSSYALEGQQPPLDLEHFNKHNTCQTLLLTLGTPETSLDPNQVTEQLLQAWADLQFTASIVPKQVGKLPETLDLQKIHQEVAIEPVDSMLDPETFEIIPGSYGYTFDKLKASRDLNMAHYGDTIRIPMEYQRPDKLDEDLLFQDVLGEAETPHGNNANRNANLKLACETLNGMILYPGDEFSFNGALGERTADKGYKAAPAYSGTRLVDSLGGGICQVSSTLYYSCLLADMEITDRVNHGFLATYIAPGMDATVSWGAPDYKFKNSSPYPIQIHAEATEDKVKVRIMGTDDRDYYIKMEYKDSFVSSNTVTQSYGPDSGYTDGQVVEGGYDGHQVVTYRCKYSKATDELISRVEEDRSSYPSKDTIIASVAAPPPAAPDSGSDSGNEGGSAGENGSGGSDSGSNIVPDSVPGENSDDSGSNEKPPEE